MENRLGITNARVLKEVEYYLFNTMYHFVDEYCTFGLDDYFSLEYLEELHKFLFISTYKEEYCKIREAISENNKKELKILLKEIKNDAYNNDLINLKENIYKLWENQIFYDGNTRTILCFLKIISNIYKLDIKYDFTKDIDKDYFINEVLESIYKEDEKVFVKKDNK